MARSDCSPSRPPPARDGTRRLSGRARRDHDLVTEPFASAQDQIAAPRASSEAWVPTVLEMARMPRALLLPTHPPSPRPTRGTLHPNAPVCLRSAAATACRAPAAACSRVAWRPERARGTTAGAARASFRPATMPMARDGPDLLLCTGVLPRALLWALRVLIHQPSQNNSSKLSSSDTS